MFGVKKKATVHFHDLKCDFRGLMEPYVPVKRICEKDGQIYSVDIDDKTTLKDSLKVITAPLGKFSKMFKLKNKKQESIAHRHYTCENINHAKASIEDYKKLLSEKDRKKFDEIFKDENMKREFEHDGKHFNASKCYKFYLEQDVLTLAEGFEKFNDMFSKLTKVSAHDHLTISSLTYRCMLIRGAFNDVVPNKGTIRKFIQRAVRWHGSSEQ